MHESTITEPLQRLLSTPSPEAAVEILRAADGADEAARRYAIEKLEHHIRASPEERQRDVVAALIALRRAGLSS